MKGIGDVHKIRIRTDQKKKRCLWSATKLALPGPEQVLENRLHQQDASVHRTCWWRIIDMFGHYWCSCDEGLRLAEAIDVLLP